MSTVETRAFLELLPPSETEGIAILWNHFAELCSIPRPSGSEQLAVEYVSGVAEANGYECQVDRIGNILIQTPAISGYEDKPGLLLQGHPDMVDVMTDDAPINPTTEGVLPVVETGGEWLRAEKTSLGADNGVGLSAGLAILEENIPHGPLGLLVTVDEERGLLGAQKVAFDLSRYRYMVNLDSENVAEMTIGCAGGEDTVIDLPIETEPIPDDKSLITLSISGLKGGHSGIDIGLVGQERVNSIKLASQITSLLSEEVACRLVSIHGGTKRNIIPSESGVVLALASNDIQRVKHLIMEFLEATIQPYSNEDSVQFDIAETAKLEDARMFSAESTRRVLEVINQLPDGVQVWSSDIQGMPETSTNLAVVNTLAESLNIRLMTRSAKTNGLKVTQAEIKSTVETIPGVEVHHEGGYPGWEPNPHSSLVNLVQTVNRELTGEGLLISATHGGLECGLLNDKYPHLEMVSIGPDIDNAHTVNERVNILSVDRFYRLVRGIVVSVANQ